MGDGPKLRLEAVSRIYKKGTKMSGMDRHVRRREMNEISVI